MRLALLASILASGAAACSLIYPGGDYLGTGGAGGAGASSTGTGAGATGGAPTNGGGGSGPTGPLAGTIFLFGGDRAWPLGTPPGLVEPFTNEVNAVDVLTDGSLGAWRYEEPLPFFGSAAGATGPLGAEYNVEEKTVRVFGSSYTLGRIMWLDGVLDGSHVKSWKLLGTQPDVGMSCAVGAECESEVCTGNPLVCQNFMQYYPSFAVSGSHGFVVGGNNNEGVGYRDIWTLGLPTVIERDSQVLSAEKWYTRSIVAGGKLFVVSGDKYVSGGQISGTVDIDVLEIAANGALTLLEVTELPEWHSLPLSLKWAALCHNDKYVYIAGGLYNNGGQSQLVAWADFTAADTQWNLADDVGRPPDIPPVLLKTPLSLSACIATEDHIYILGGNNSSGQPVFEVEVAELDPGTGSPKQFALDDAHSLAHGRLGATAVFVPAGQ